MANGMPSRRRQISTTASASPGWASEKSDTTLWARSTKRFTAADSVPELTSSDGTRHNCSSLTPNPSRLVARIVTVAEAARIASTRSATAVDNVLAVVEHQQPDSALQRGGDTDSATLLPGCWVMPSTAATASGTAAGSATAASSKNQTPSGNSSASRAATSSARRVLPTPPTPVNVTNR